MVAETKMLGRVWEHKETLLSLEKWGDATATAKIMHKRKACIGRNCGISSSCML